MHSFFTAKGSANVASSLAAVKLKHKHRGTIGTKSAIETNNLLCACCSDVMDSDHRLAFFRPVTLTFKRQLKTTKYIRRCCGINHRGDCWRPDWWLGPVAAQATQSSFQEGNCFHGRPVMYKDAAPGFPRLAVLFIIIDQYSTGLAEESLVDCIYNENAVSWQA